MNVLGKTTLYVNGFDGEEKGTTRLSFSVGIISKNSKDEWETTFLPVVLSNAVKENLKIDNKSLDELYKRNGKYGKDIKQRYNIKLEGNNAWLTTQKFKDKTNVALFINDLTIVTETSSRDNSRERR